LRVSYANTDRCKFKHVYDIVKTYTQPLRYDTWEGVGSVPTYVTFWLRRSFRHGALMELWNCH